MLAPISLLILAMISIQTGAGLAKNLFPVTGAAGATSFRLFFASAILWAIWRPWRFSFQKAHLKNLFLYGSSLGLMNLTFYFALDRIPLGLAVTLEFIGPLALSIFSSRQKRDFFWALLAGVGVYMVMPQGEFNHATDPVGIVFALTAGMFWAFYIYFGKKAGQDNHGGITAALGMSFAALVAIPFGIMIDGEKLFNLSIIPLAILVAVLSSALPYSLEMYSLKKMPTKTFGILLSLEPVIASFVGLIFLKELLTVTQWFAILCVMLASLGSSVTASKKY